MRSYAEQNLHSYSRFVSVDGSAENTTLENNSVNLVSVGQALHWFDRDKARSEFSRILEKRNGHVLIVYNERKKNATGLMKGYERIINKHAKNKASVPEIDDDYLQKFFNNKEYKKFTIPNQQHLDSEGLVGRAASASYSPSFADGEFESLRRELIDIFNASQKNGKVTMLYDTLLYLGQIQT